MSEGSKQKILVTGGTGYIGSHTAVALISVGYDHVIIDNLSSSKIAVLDRIEAITGKRPVFYQADLRDRSALDAVFQENAISAVIHFAGLKAVGESVAEPLRYYENNIEGTLSLCSVMAAHGVKCLIFSSSATVYGEPSTVPIRENFPLAPASPYGRTKLMIEQILQDLHVADPAWQIVLLRYFNPVAAHESSLIGEDPSGIPNNLMPYISQVAVGRRERLSVYGNDYPTPDGTGVRDYIHVMDLAEGHVAALRYMEGLDSRLRGNDRRSGNNNGSGKDKEFGNDRKSGDDKVSGKDKEFGNGRENEDDKEGRNSQGRTTGPLIVNLGTGQGYSVLEMVRAFEKASGKTVPYRIVDRRPGDIATCYADPSRARALLGWSARRTLADMCADTWRWQEKNPEGYEY